MNYEGRDQALILVKSAHGDLDVLISKDESRIRWCKFHRRLFINCDQWHPTRLNSHIANFFRQMESQDP